MEILEILRDAVKQCYWRTNCSLKGTYRIKEVLRKKINGTIKKFVEKSINKVYNVYNVAKSNLNFSIFKSLSLGAC